MNVFRLIAGDLRQKSRWLYESDRPAAIVQTLLTDGTFAMLVYRLMQWSRRWRLGPLELLFNKVNTLFGGCVIGRGAEFGPGFVLIHSDGVFINGRTRGGRDIFIEHQVTIGADRRQSPVLGDDIVIAAGAKILGAITVGSGSRIGANAVVTADVPPYTIMAGNPARAAGRRSPGPPPP